jgi:hypothetical protein
MKKASLSLMTVLLTCFIILSVGIAGCTSQAPSAPPAPATKTSTVEPAELLLQLSDMPANFTLVEKGERNASEMNEWALDIGWKKGSYAVFQKNDPREISGATIEQYTSVYPAENISLVVPDTVQSWKIMTVEENSANVTLEEISLPTIGDSSAALKYSNTTDNTRLYVITFSKKDVFQNLFTNGTATDFETVQQLARVAAAKIK